MTVKLASTVRNMCAFARPFLSYRLRGRITPVLAGYKITNRCNLRCTHCPYWKRVGMETDFAGAVDTMERLREMGVRILILEGGEPLLWSDGMITIRDVIAQAHELFECVCMTTNGLLPWGELPLDRVWVSLDGPPSVNNAIRGNGTFERVWENLEVEGKGKAFISTTISTENAESVPELIRMLKGRVAGVTVQFYYPYDGLPDPRFITAEDRAPILDEMMRLKREGFPVANSFSSLEDLKKRRWTCEDRLLANAEPDGTVSHGCYLKNRGKSDCTLCGFTAHNEMSLAFAGRAESILTGMKIFFPAS